jgi:hypothetical protein
MSTDQRETILMLVNVEHRHLPSSRPVAKVALRSVFAAVDVSVAVLTLAAGVGENAIDMTLLAGNVAVNTAQRKRGLIVVKLRILADRHPPCRHVTVLTRNAQQPVRILRCRHQRDWCPYKHQ